MVRFVTFVHKDLFPDKYLWSSTWEIHLKILQPTPWEPVSIVEVVNKSEHERKTSSPQHSRCSYASGELIRINFHPKTAEKMAPHCMARLDLVNCMLIGYNLFQHRRLWLCAIFAFWFNFEVWSFHSIKRGVILTFYTFCSNKKPEAQPRAFYSQNV